MTTRQTALTGLMSGTCLALGIMGTIAARTAYAITRAHRWADFQRIR